MLLAGLAYLCIKYSGHRLVPQKEYGSARWGTAADIAPFLHEKASENIPLTATESLSLAMKMLAAELRVKKAVRPDSRRQRNTSGYGLQRR